MDIGNNKTSAESIMQSLKESDIPQDIIDSIGTAYAQNGFSDLVDASADKLIDCPREIVFKIEGTVLNQSNEGEIVGSEFIFDQSYHIPVPTGINYKDSINAFLNHFTSSLEQTSKELWRDHV
jgi:hypothetical protein|tara:strand:- start:217 stop:585 length:369 start_codon:yes stop_codon:yes gene_type:complete